MRRAAYGIVCRLVCHRPDRGHVGDGNRRAFGPACGGGAGKVLAHNPTRDIAVVVDVHGVRECGHVGKVHFIGMLKRIENAQLSRYRLYNFAFAERDSVQWWLCAECQPGGEWEPVMWLFAATAFFGWFGVRMFRARVAKATPAPQVQQRPVAVGNTLAAKRRRNNKQRK
jgi:hypothetical protein